ncbi:SGNH/GDSL hydrolase family protein [Halotia branconii]|uniref:SGNH/GDSL hydrolase family protein n=1 Tax=Halotia branconii CENA392 TaxID=1539056 RepID=A0AAJ6NTL6_9CYAN|nr:SGNH/GDSL hydrolase family protein [Halotia branconii]WGV26375.1 SGNH/GDSL hydrolase family protein [Halotia branconii CENA392]
MKKQLMAAGFVLFSLALPLKAEAFTGLSVIGDSLSDTGNLYNLTLNPQTGVGFPPPPYFEGRFSNGPIWIDELAQKLNLEAPTPYINFLNGATPESGINFAFGGATTTDVNTIVTGLPSFPQEVAALTALQPADPEALYVLWIGANDYLPTQSPDFIPFVNPDTTLASISNALQTLASVGVKNVIVPNLPNLGNTPLALNLNQLIPDTSERLNQLTKDHNDGLSQLIKSFNQNPVLGLNIISLDVNSLFSDPANLGFTNFTQPCLNRVAQTICNNPNEYLYWDEIHPTARAHSIVANAALAAIPEPSAVLGMLALGALGAAGVLKRQHKKSTFTPISRVLAAQSSRITVEN